MEEKKKSRKGLVVIIVLLILVILGLVGYICYDKGIIFKQDKEVVKKEKKKDTKKEEKEEKKVCVGKYYGEYKNGGYDLKYTYELKDDNTYSFNTGTSGNEGTYVIEGNKIVFEHDREISGPEASKITEEYEIADDCSYIIINDSESNITSFKLNKQ